MRGYGVPDDGEGLTADGVAQLPMAVLGVLAASIVVAGVTSYLWFTERKRVRSMVDKGVVDDCGLSHKSFVTRTSRRALEVICAHTSSMCKVAAKA